jgi:hypothetical protein
MSKQKNNDKLVPNGTDGTVPEHTIESNLTGKVEIDTQSKLVDPRTQKEIFLHGMAVGLFDGCANPAQVNKMIGEIKGNGKPAPYMVSEVSHRWERVNGKWTDKGDAWVAANPFTPGVGHARENYKGRLSDDDYKALQGQLVALRTMSGDMALAVAPLVVTITEKIVNHEAAVKLEAIGQAAIRRRKAIMERVECLLRENDKAGGVYPLMIDIADDGTCGLCMLVPTV